MSTEPSTTGDQADADGRSAAQPTDNLRLLFAAPFPPRWDNRHGGRVVAQLVSRLADRHRVALVCLRTPGSRPIDPNLAARCELAEEVEVPGSRWLGPEWRHRINVLSTPLTGRPSPVAAVYSREFATAIQRTARRWRPDIIQVEHDGIAYCAPFIDGLARGTLLVCHDPGLRASQDLVRVTSARQRLAHRVDAATWRRYWSRTFRKFDAVVAFTDDDAGLLRATVPGLRVVRIPLGIDLPTEPLGVTSSDDPTVLFIGGYHHQPNADAAMRLIRSIAPAVRREIPALRLVLVGDRPTEEMRRDAGTHDVITGTVESVAPFLAEASLLALPIRLGGGMRVKLLEALAAGMPVVASPVAASGLDLSDGHELVMADSDDQFRNAIVRLLRNHTTREALARNGREWAMHNLSWDSRVLQYERLYQSLLHPRAL